MASTRPPGTYSPKRPDWQAWRRVWGRGPHGPARGLRRVADVTALNRPGGQFGGQHPPPEPAEHSVQVSGLL